MLKNIKKILYMGNQIINSKKNDLYISLKYFLKTTFLIMITFYSHLPLNNIFKIMQISNKFAITKIFSKTNHKFQNTNKLNNSLTYNILNNNNNNSNNNKKNNNNNNNNNGIRRNNKYYKHPSTKEIYKKVQAIKDMVCFLFFIQSLK